MALAVVSVAVEMEVVELVASFWIDLHALPVWDLVLVRQPNK